MGDAAASRRSLTIAVHDGLDPAIDEVAAAERPARSFLQRSWFAAASDSARTRTLIARRGDGQAIVALPVARGRFGLRAVPGSYWPFRSFPVAPDITDAEGAAFLSSPRVRRALGPAWRLGPVYADDPALLAVERAAARSGWRLFRRPMAKAYRLDFATATAEGPWPRGSTLRKNRQYENQMARHGALDWRATAGSDLDPGMFDAFAAIEAKSWHAGSRDAKFLAPLHRRVWDALLGDPDQARRMRVTILAIGGTPAAGLFEIAAGDTSYAVATSYDPAFATHSPGKCLHYRALAAAQARGARLVDWGAGDSGYKSALGAKPGPEILDCLIVRRPLAVVAGPAIARLWRR